MLRINWKTVLGFVVSTGAQVLQSVDPSQLHGTAAVLFGIAGAAYAAYHGRAVEKKDK